MRLREAVNDLSWLLTRGYAGNSGLKIVGDRYALAARQRQAVARCACSENEKSYRASTRISEAEVHGKELLIDGFNLLTTVEAALGGGVILHARDGCTRDMASVHGSYRHVQETRPALLMIGECARILGVKAATWYLDRPISNSGRLRGLILDLAQDQKWAWDVELVFNPDELLAASEGSRHIGQRYPESLPVLAGSRGDVTERTGAQRLAHRPCNLRMYGLEGWLVTESPRQSGLLINRRFE